MNISTINAQLAKIPADASVAATGNIVPHLALRDRIHFLPSEPDDVDYIVVLSSKTHPYLKEKDLISKIEMWKSDPQLTVKFENKDLIIFKKM